MVSERIVSLAILKVDPAGTKTEWHHRHGAGTPNGFRDVSRANRDMKLTFRTNGSGQSHYSQSQMSNPGQCKTATPTATP